MYLPKAIVSGTRSDPSSRKWPVIVAVAALGFLGLGAAQPPRASALAVEWQCNGLQPNQWCFLNENHSYVAVRARWSSTNAALAMCSKLAIPSNPEIIYARNCATAVEVWANTSASTSALVPKIANGNNASNHDIYGYAKTG
jgi:hypothetical protein